MKTISIKYKLNNDLQTRWASSFVYDIQKLNTDLFITNGERLVNANSLLGLLSLNLQGDEHFTIRLNDKSKQEKIQTIISEYAQEVK